MKPPRMFLRLSFVFAIALTGMSCSHRVQTANPQSPSQYFEDGSIGTEIVPLPVFLVLPYLSPTNLQPAGEKAGDWVEQFGFIRRHDAHNEYDLPVGFTVTYHEPRTGKRVPIPFVGLTCAVCHDGEIRFSDPQKNILVPGMGNPAVDLVAYGDAVKSAVLDETLTVAKIYEKYAEKYHRLLNPVEIYAIGKWLRAIRKDIRSDIGGLPFSGMNLRESKFFPSGPGRIMAARDSIKRLKNEMPVPDGGPSKLPALYHQGRREWAQFDGSVRNPLTRNAIAALGVGATTGNLQVPDLLATIVQSYSYVLSLNGPDYHSVFTDIDQASANRGRGIYLEHCFSCHGAPGAEPGEWRRGERLGAIIPVSEIGTDPARVTPQYYDDLACLFVTEYPAGHPLKPQASDVRATHGYVTTPIESVFSRAPYLHNGSIPTLAELINLKPRRDLFFRGTDLYDVTDVGLLVSDLRDDQHYYAFKTSVPGNSNRGHDYPWPYHGPGWDEAKLRDLLEYLKTL